LALEDYLTPGISVLDVGTGSGILAEAARLLGARIVYTCDTDPCDRADRRQRLCRIGG
jgi:ribosomal protein L11 methyltransferase